MDSVAIAAEARNMDTKAKKIRREGRLPAVYYGKDVESMHIDMDYQDFRKAFRIAGQNTIIDLNVNGKEHKALVQSVDFDPVSDQFIHVDFIAVDLNKEVTTHVPLTFVGESNAVRNLSGILNVTMHEVTVKCKAKDLIHEIEVDLAPLEDFHSVLHISDIVVPDTVTLMDDPELTIATVSAPKSDAEVEAEEAASAEAASAALEAAKDEGGDEEKSE